MAARRCVLDACVLYDAPVRDLLLRLGSEGTLEPLWSARILDECWRALAENRPDITADQMSRLRAALERAFPRACIATIRSFGVSLPDHDDTHVLETALAAGAPVIVTYNLRDFPADLLQPHGVTAWHPDVLVTDILDANPSTVARVVTQQAAAMRRPPVTLERLLATLSEHGLHRSVARLRTLLAGGAE